MECVRGTDGVECVRGMDGVECVRGMNGVCEGHGWSQMRAQQQDAADRWGVCGTRGVWGRGGRLGHEGHLGQAGAYEFGEGEGRIRKGECVMVVWSRAVLWSSACA
eukprot:1155430-Pelagomonas_calceolata.AAC.4